MVDGKQEVVGEVGALKNQNHVQRGEKLENYKTEAQKNSGR